MKIKVGFGFDVHQLKSEADFWLGGIKIDHHKGAVGQSDVVGQVDSQNKPRAEPMLDSNADRQTD